MPNHCSGSCCGKAAGRGNFHEEHVRVWISESSRRDKLRKRRSRGGGGVEHWSRPASAVKVAASKSFAPSIWSIWAKRKFVGYRKFSTERERDREGSVAREDTALSLA